MKRLFMSLILLGIATLSGCVVAPYGYGYGYHRSYGPRVAVVVAPVPVAPLVVVR
ncbi:MAG TPA: hypothetical protein VKT22_03240 [Steroidobacteraceae bacterium]|nr:hypothetical protein [Steroidobacteraceae bacterium]